jgi:hypothetical protein
MALAIIAAVSGGAIALMPRRAASAAAARGPGEAEKPAGGEAAAGDSPGGKPHDHQPAARAADIYSTLERFAGLPRPAEEDDDRRCERTAQVMTRVCANGYRRVRALLATVPDPQDSRFAKLFDDLVSAMRVALERSGFVDDRFFDPWQSDPPAGGGPARRHRDQPGMLLFRREETKELVVLLLVGETPTSGVQRRAMRAALDLAAAITASPCGGGGPAAAPQAIPVIAPTMSGTRESLRVILTGWFDDQRSRRAPGPYCGAGPDLPFNLEFVSGAATSDDNQRVLDTELTAEIRGIFPRFTSTFHGATRSDDEKQKFVIEYLAQRLGTCNIALLAESSTSYGQQITASSRHSRAILCQDGSPIRLINLSFPLHISKLRGERAAGASAAPAPAAPTNILKRLQTLERDESEVEEDAFPTKSRMTQPVSEIALLQILHAIATEDVRAVVIVASATADVLFLVEKVRLSFPNVTVVVNDADLVYLHDDISFMDGVLVASTYPLFPWAQRVTYPFEGDSDRLLFPSSAAEGTYNAALLLLADKKNARVMDYGPPFVVPAADFQPSLWMTVVSKNAFWPLAVAAPRGGSYLRQATAPPPVAGDETERTIWTLPRSFVFELGGFILVVLNALLAWAYLRGQGASTSARDPGAGRFRDLFLPPKNFPHKNMRHLELAVLLLTLSIVTAGFFAIGVVIVIPPEGEISWRCRMLTLATGICTLVMHGLAAHAFLRLGGVGRRRAPLIAAAVVAAVSLAGGAGGFSRLHALWRAGQEGGRVTHLMFFIERARNLDSGVSLLWMGLLLGAGHALWILGHLRQARIVEEAAALRAYGVIPAARHHEATHDLSLLGSLQLAEPMRAAAREAEGVSPSPLTAAFMALVFVYTMLISRQLVYFEGAAWGWICAVAYALLLALVVYGCARYVRTWRVLEELLARVAPLSVTDALQRIPAELLTSFKRPWDSQVFAVWQRHCQAMFAEPRTDPKLIPKWSAALDANEGALQKLLAAPVAAQIEGAEKNPPVPQPPLTSEQWANVRDDFIAMRLVAFVQYIRAHLANFVAVSTAALLPALWATNFYPLRENRFLLMLVLVITGGAIAVAALVFVQMSRNYVLSRMAHTNPGVVTWNRSFVTSLLVHVAIPLLALLAVKFPEFSQGWSAIIAALSSTGGS